MVDHRVTREGIEALVADGWRFHRLATLFTELKDFKKVRWALPLRDGDGD